MTKALAVDNIDIDSSLVKYENNNFNNMINSLTDGIARKISGWDLDFNSIVQYGDGFYGLFGSTKNTPDNNTYANAHWYCWQINHNNQFCVQFAISLWDTNSNLYMRKMLSGNWTSWKSTNFS